LLTGTTNTGTAAPFVSAIRCVSQFVRPNLNQTSLKLPLTNCNILNKKMKHTPDGSIAGNDSVAIGGCMNLQSYQEQVPQQESRRMIITSRLCKTISSNLRRSILLLFATGAAAALILITYDSMRGLGRVAEMNSQQDKLPTDVSSSLLKSNLSYF
jgi:hypothetical protein